MTILNTTSDASFYYTDTVQGVYTITVSDGGALIDAEQAVTVTAAPATELVFTHRARDGRRRVSRSVLSDWSGATRLVTRILPIRR